MDHSEGGSSTVIEVALIVSMMIEGGADKAGLARDTVLAAILITCGGIVGVCLVAGGVRHHEQGFQYQGALGALAVLIALSVLTLIIPNVTISAPSSELSSPQLGRYNRAASTNQASRDGTRFLGFQPHSFS
jgi:Ca2+:H+ antiporter